MEIDLLQPNDNGDWVEDTFSPVVSGGYNVFGDPDVLPRVGDQYQVEIPQLLTKSDYLSYTRNPTDADIVVVPCDFLMGLPVPIMWINKQVGNMKNEGVGLFDDLNDKSKMTAHFESESIREAQINLKDEDLKVESLALDFWTQSGGSPNLALEQEMRNQVHQDYRGLGYLVPGSFGDSWSSNEEASFILGLYIFGKNLVLVKRFIESKNMGDILSFYYGKFYRSNGYRRWSDCRKMRSRRCVYGQKIFTGLRQQELLSRLLPHASEECQNSLLEISRTFGEGKMSFEEYVFNLKAIIGMKRLVEAVGIGKRKQDITRIVLEPPKSNHVIPVRSEMPIGKACSSLTPREIMKFLTGDFRLSKARSNDLFWEAIWPRLLARGWHSEQPKNQSYAAGSKHCLVFLMPGVKKFSRRRLVKGNHYFDSVSDVLSKVASEPGLLQLDNEADDCSRRKDEYAWTSEAKLEQDDLSERQPHCYLQPRTPKCSTKLMKFTVVDTSLADGKAFNVRELRTLPVDASKNTISEVHCEESEGDTSVFSTDESDSSNSTSFDEKETNFSKHTKAASDVGLIFDGRNLQFGALKQAIPINGPDSKNAPLKIAKDCSNLCAEKQPRKSAKGNLKWKLKQETFKYLSPVTKRRRKLTACSHAETNHGMIGSSVRARLEQEKHNCCSDTQDSSENITWTGSSRKRVSSFSSSKGSPSESSGGIFCDTVFGAEHPCEKPQTRTLIDLNVPQVPSDFGTAEIFEMELREGQDDQMSNQPDVNEKTSMVVASSEQQPNMNSRRQSTRVRPPTARALEALANGFLTTKTNKKRKGTEVNPRENLTSRPSRRARCGVGITEKFGICTVASKAEEGGNGVCNGKRDTFSKSPVLSKGNMTRVSGS
ncbi:uncharacterized protein LOC132294683 isoform X2 [Cornus florida]|uniref:uncharacterized protein LOC132294683 isoform X2 n=1 Tax=Cornus florida TaxID=4283 RepID=UPI00289ED1D2|nr:uncharacterized protein LOC132294683 isoform X2 [Cornus florida]XP_059648620.1 uncharacterized protein LOC132294683 isoform X2 [Cornus florida]